MRDKLNRYGENIVIGLVGIGEEEEIKKIGGEGNIGKWGWDK